MSDKQTQKDAVYSAVTSVLNENGVQVDSDVNVSSVLTRELRAQVTSILVEGFLNNRISLDKQFDSNASLRAYCSGLMSNWLKKDKRLNGGAQFSIKNPGSRRGSSDPQIKAMRALLATRSNETERAEIQAFIDNRISEISVTNNKQRIDVSNIPAELKHLLS